MFSFYDRVVYTAKLTFLWGVIFCHLSGCIGRQIVVVDSVQDSTHRYLLSPPCRMNWDGKIQSSHFYAVYYSIINKKKQEKIVGFLGKQLTKTADYVIVSKRDEI